MLALLTACGDAGTQPASPTATQQIANVTATFTLPPPTPSFTPTLADTATATNTATSTATSTNIHTPTPSHTPTASHTPTPSDTPTPSVTPTPRNTATPSDTPTPIPTRTLPPPPVPPPPVNASPGNPQPYLSRYRLVTFYGSPYGRALGILGNSPRNEMLGQLRRIVAEYQPLSSSYVMPAYHMVSTVANQNPPHYNHQVELPVLENWIYHAEANNAAAILDIQPGRGNIIDEVNRVKYLLYRPHVHLAIDPEFVMNDEQTPGVQVGQMTADHINAVQIILNQIAIESGVKRVLIIHQFKNSMVQDKQFIVSYPNVELVIDSDGTFSTDVKLYNYNQYMNEPGFDFGGIKIFYNHDDYILSATDVMSLSPQPSVIIYQ